jgi:hypothetical protein
MDEAEITGYDVNTFPGVDVATNAGDRFFIYDPRRDFPDTKRWPFATLVTADNYDQFSNLNRSGVFRLNVGVGKATFQSLFPAGGAGDDVTRGHDFAALDRLMPHPVYARQYWVCVLNPSDATFEQTIKSLLAEAYELVVKRFGAE